MTQENEKNKKLSRSISMLINCIYDPVLVVDVEDSIVGINQAIEKYIPYPMKQQIGEIFTQLDISSEEKWRWR
jgi:PAS domain-containing protein